MNLKLRYFLVRGVATLLLFGGFVSLQAVSIAEMASDMRKDSHFYMVSLETSISNFGTDENKKTYEEIKKKYVSAVSFYYERDFPEAYRAYKEIQEDIETLAGDLSSKYIERSQKMLVDFSSRIIDLEVKYDKNSELAKTLRTNRLSYLNKESGKEVMSARFYSPKIVHYTYDRFSILDNLEYGYGNLGKAKEVRERAQALDKLLLEGQKPTTRMLDKKIRAYLGSIELCRDAKANAIRMFQLYNRYDNYTVQGDAFYDKETKEFKENPFLNESKIDPIFDQRIPEEYRVDAEDVRHRNYKEQIEMKIEGKAFGEEKTSQNDDSHPKEDADNSEG